jgi:small conductance mechanosensitive channel
MADAWEALAKELLHYLPRLGFSLLVVLAFWYAGKGIQRLIIRLTHGRRLDAGLVSFLSGSAKTALVLLGLVTALGTLGVDVTALVAGLGLTGLALGFAMKEIISNALSGIMILFYKPFRLGDSVNVTSFEGTVIEVNLRYTVLDAETRLIFVPNTNLITNPVTVKKRDVAQLAEEFWEGGGI